MAFLDDMGLGNIGSSIGGGVSSLVSIMYWVVILLIPASIIYWFYNRTTYKHTIILKKLSDDKSRKITITDKYKYIRTKAGEEFILLLNLKLKLPTPQPQAINTTKKGKEHIVAYLSGTDQAIYLEDKFDNTDELKTKGFFSPLTSNQRIQLIRQYDLANNRNKNSLKDMLMTFIPLGILALVIVVGLIFAEDAIKPLVQMQDNNLQIAMTQKEIMDKQIETHNVILDELRIVTGKELPNNIPIPPSEVPKQ